MVFVLNLRLQKKNPAIYLTCVNEVVFFVASFPGCMGGEKHGLGMRLAALGCVQ